ncbi:hypothetical protein SLEP1_g6979 [Rubroshorea leprosula]|uniref:Reverse transcriptase Ty1/copia-type domain-containing protein n=1 Tax=Rubroshorea leprosula TaxID=152421 RepID=A0AAV5I7R3_9ROSI|nr:hypothetical protein SLEP1_g6979 [Rubroshorea leprosula]
MDTNSILHAESRKSLPLQYFDDDDPPEVDQPTIIQPKQPCPRNVDSANSSVDACNVAHGEGDANPTITRTSDASHGDVANPINSDSRPQCKRRKPTYLTEYILNGVQTNTNTSLTSAIAVACNWELHQLDVHNAFLHGDLNEEVYMQLPPGYGNKGEQCVCRLRKSLYGLKKASRNWFAKFASALKLFGNNSSLCQKLKEFLHTMFHIKDLGKLKYFLAGMLGTKPCPFPMEQKMKLTPCIGSPLSDPMQYRRLVGKLIHLTITRPEISFAVHTLSQFMQAPRQPHLDATMRVWRYLKSSPGQGIFLSSSSSLQLSAYCDSDWASCPTTRRSTTGYLTLLGNSPISWKTKKQSTVSRSSAKAEYRAMASTVSELLWLKGLLQTLGVDTSQPMQLHCDNQAAIHIATNPVFHERTKHIELDCHFIRHWIQVGLIKTSHVRSNLQVADIFTKALGGDQFQFLLCKLGITDLHAPT